MNSLAGYTISKSQDSEGYIGTVNDLTEDDIRLV